jgi:thiol-disulfide isomerase/thioredoxin
MARGRNKAGGVIVCLISLFVCFGAATCPAHADSFDLKDYRGKVIIVHFWASWSDPCRRSFPWLDAIQDKYGDQGLVVVGINEDDDELAARKFLQKFPVTFASVTDTDGELFESFDLIAIPSTYLIDRDGRTVARYLGFNSTQAPGYEAALRNTLTTGLNTRIAQQ